LSACYGRLEIIKWAHTNGYQMHESTCSWTALNGHFEILKWVRSNGCSWDKSKCMIEAKKYPEIAAWIESQE